MKASKLLPLFMVAVALGFAGALPSSMSQDQQSNLPSASPGQQNPIPGQGPIGPHGQRNLPIKGVKNTFLELGEENPAVLYEPVKPGKKSQIAVLIMHSDRNYLQFSGCGQLAMRGYRVLCATTGGGLGHNGRSTVNGMDRRLLDLSAAVAYLRKYPGVREVVLWGHSGGGTLMSAYQDIAENGLKACQGSEKIIKCDDSLAKLPPADGVMLVDSNWGLAAMTLFSVDPAIVSEDDGQKLNPDLDMFNPANGFRATGSTYSDEFVHKFLSAESKRYSHLIKTAEERLSVIDAGKGHYLDDEPLIMPGASQAFFNNKLYTQDIRLMSHTRKAWPLLHADGSITTQVVYSVRLPENTESFSPWFSDDGAVKTSVRNFLSTYAVRANDDYGYDADSVYGIDWTSSYSDPPGTVQGITVPMLVMGMTGSFEFMAAESIYENTKSADKTLAYVEGAAHTYETCKECEKKPGQFGDTLKTIYDYADNWLSQKGRFMNGREQ